jgi:chaperonin GroEL
MSSSKEIIFEDSARDKLKNGILTLCSVAEVTLGPKGRNVGLSSAYGAPSITSDGHSIVKEIELKDQYENMGAQMAIEVCSKMKQECGDGTTTSLVLMNALTQNGVKLVTSGASPILIKRGMEKALKKALSHIDQDATKISDAKDIYKIAEASSSGSKEIAEMLTEAFKSVKSFSSVMIEEGKLSEDNLEIVNGLQIERGFISPHFCTNRDKMELEIAKPKVLIIDKKIQSIHELVPILQKLAPTGSPLFLVVDDLDSDTLAALIINHIRGILKIGIIKAPGFGDNKKAQLEDLAALCGTEVISEEKGMHLKDLELSHLGSCEKVLIAKDKTLITQNDATKEDVKKRLDLIDHLIAQTTSSYDKDKLLERKAKLSLGIAKILVGAPSEVEMKKRKQLYQDALSSTKAALEEGVVTGGGICLAAIASKIEENLEGDEKLGFDLVKKALKAPALQLIKNVGMDPLSTLETCLSKGKNIGVNMLNEEIEDLFKHGIYDAAKVVKTALTLAVSQASLVLLSEALIGFAKEDS